MMVSRTGFTGDLGYELWMQPADAEAVWDALMAVGSSRARAPDRLPRAQHGAHRGGLRAAEPGLRLRGAHAVPGHRALAAGARTRAGWWISTKGHFTGRRALLAEQARGPRRQLVGLDIEGTKPAHNALLYTDRSGRKRRAA